MTDTQALISETGLILETIQNCFKKAGFRNENIEMNEEESVADTERPPEIQIRNVLDIKTSRINIREKYVFDVR